MSFSKILKGIGDAGLTVLKQIGSAAQDYADHLRQLKEKYTDMDDDELYRILKRNSAGSREYLAAYSVLKDRYGSEEVKEKIRNMRKEI